MNGLENHSLLSTYLKNKKKNDVYVVTQHHFQNGRQMFRPYRHLKTNETILTKLHRVLKTLKKELFLNTVPMASYRLFRCFSMQQSHALQLSSH